MNARFAVASSFETQTSRVSDREVNEPGRLVMNRWLVVAGLRLFWGAYRDRIGPVIANIDRHLTSMGT